jgi:hypothetical protein
VILIAKGSVRVTCRRSGHGRGSRGLSRNRGGRVHSWSRTRRGRLGLRLGGRLFDWCWAGSGRCRSRRHDAVRPRSRVSWRSRIGWTACRGINGGHRRRIAPRDRAGPPLTTAAGHHRQTEHTDSTKLDAPACHNRINPFNWGPPALTYQDCVSGGNAR